jgi:glycerol kinase
MDYILSLDQGTTSSRAVLIDNKGHWVAEGQRPFRQIYPEPGWVEHDPEEIWQTVLDSISDCLQKANISPSAIKAIGITNQRETLVAWDRKTGQPLHNAIVWQCRRSQKICEDLKKQKKEKIFKKKTGLVLDPYFSGTKIRWLMENLPGFATRARRGEVAVGTIDTWLLWKLTAGEAHKTDVSNASRTLLMNLKTLDWDSELLQLLKVPAQVLPSIHPSNHRFGETKNLSILPNGLPIHSLIGDQQSALFGQNCFKEGEAKCTFGTGSFLLLNTGHRAQASRSGSLTTVAWQLEGQKPTYALEGGAFICGAAVQWLRDGLGLFEHSYEVEQLAASVPSTQGVEFVPALAGLGAPHWRPEARGLILGLTRGSTKAHIARATLEAMALQNVDLLEAMKKDLKKPLKKLRVDGGASKNDLLMQMQADYSQLLVERPEIFETTALGAALMAGLGAGLFPDLQSLEKIWKKEAEFKPQLKPKLRAERLRRWLQAVRRA